MATAGTALWPSFEPQIVSWLAQGRREAAQPGIARLAQTTAALRGGGSACSASIAAHYALSWQACFTETLERLQGGARVQAAEHLQRLVHDHAASATGPSPASGAVTGENVRIQADHHSFAAGMVNGDVHMASPSAPDPTQG
ncbi:MULTISPECIES: hypothetical protein [unclassified Streptomyces]|uniref:hypothetical protein n=1 Tax=unclassified Streptomyces TaxID=2593676 RepID=UPI0035DEA907